MVKPKFRIFVDTNVLISEFFAGNEFQLEKLILVSKVSGSKLLTTTITQFEFAKNAATNVYEKISCIEDEYSRKLIYDITKMKLPELNKGDIYRQKYEDFHKMIVSKTSRKPWNCLDSNNVDLNLVFSKYGRREGIFEEGAKKNQFADAIVFEQIKNQQSDNVPIVIFSKDKDFKLASSKEENIEHVESWENLLGYLEIEDQVPKMQDFLESQEKMIVDMFIELMDANSPDDYELIMTDYIRSVDVKQGPSMKSEQTIYISGIVEIKVELPFGYALNFIPLSKLNLERVDSMRTPIIETIVKIHVNVEMIDHGNHQFSGNIVLRWSRGLLWSWGRIEKYMEWNVDGDQ